MIVGALGRIFRTVGRLRGDRPGAASLREVGEELVRLEDRARAPQPAAAAR